MTTISIVENTRAVALVTAVDADGGQTFTYSIAGGADAAKFTINASTGALAFGAAPNFENATDADLDNVYEVIVQASDGNGGADTQALAVTVTDGNEASGSPSTILAEDSSVTWSTMFSGQGPATGVSALHGTLVTSVSGGPFSATFTATYTPDANYHGPDTIRYTLSGVPHTRDVLVTPVNDAPTGGVSITGARVVGEILTANTFPGDADGAGTLHYVWQRSTGNGGFIPIGADVPTYTLTGADLGSQIRVHVFYTDADGTPERLLSSPTSAVLNANSAPIIISNGGGITEINDAPAGTDNTVSTSEDTPRAFTIADFGFTDPNDSPANAVLSVIIATLPAAGTLTFQGTPVNAGDEIAIADIGNLVFTPVANANGAGYSSFTFQVRDAGGGTDLDPSPNTLTIDVNAVNDAPAGTDRIVSTDDDVPYVFTAGDFGFSDPNDNPPNALLAVKVTTVPSAGVLKNGATTLVGGEIVSVSDIVAGNLTFTPASDAHGAGYASFTFQVQDDGGAGFSPSPIMVFSSNFDGSLPSEVDPGVATPTGVQGYAGYGPSSNQFGGNFLRSPTGNIVTLQLDNLPPHIALNLSFLFAAIDSLDGTGVFPAGDFFNVKVDGVSIFRESFANALVTQIQSYVSPAAAELARRVDLGFSGPGGFYTDSAYNLGADQVFQNIPHTASSVTLSFQIEGVGIQDLNDESWAIDNLIVSVMPPATNDLDPTPNTITIDVDGNESPVITSNGGGASASISVAENITAVTTVTATDPDAGQTLSYSISGTDAAKFTIDSATGVLAFVTAPNFEAPADAGGVNVYDVTVEASDGQIITPQLLAVTVTDVNDAPVILTGGGEFTVFENTTSSSTWSQVFATDEDTGQTLSYTISGADADKFTLQYHSVLGEARLSFATAPNFEVPTDADGDNVYEVEVQVSDGHGGIDTQAIALAVTDVNEAPVGVADSFAGQEDTLLAIPAATLLANDSDPDQGDTLSIASVGNAVNGSAVLNGGDVVFTPAADFSGQASFDYTVSDGFGGTATATVNLDVAPLADGPTLQIADLTPQPAATQWGVHQFQANTYVTNNQSYPSVAALPGGGFVVTWSSFGQDDPITSSWGIYGQRYDANAKPVGAEFRVNGSLPGDQKFSSVAALADGGFVVTWSSFGEDGPGSGIYGHRYNADGTSAGPQFGVNSYTISDQVHSSVAALDDGGFVVTWSSMGEDGDSWGIYGQRYGASGAPTGAEFQINTYATSAQQYPAVTDLTGGGFVVMWSSVGQDGSGYGVYGQAYNADGTPAGTEFQVNTYTSSDQFFSSVAGLSDGSFVVTWASAGEDGSGFGIYGQRFHADGTQAGTEFRINTETTADQLFSSVSALPDGGFVVTWQSLDDSGAGVFGQRFDDSGNLVGQEFRLNEATAGDQRSGSFLAGDAVYGTPTLALAGGQLVQAWWGAPNVSGSEVYARLFTLPSTAVAGLENQPLALPTVTAALNDTDGSETLVLRLSGFPEGATFSKGALDVATGEWVIADPADITSLNTTPLNMTLPQDWNGSFDLVVTAVVSDAATLSTGAASDTTSLSKLIPITVAASVNQPPMITSNDGGDTAPISVAENTTAVTMVTATDPDAGQTLTYSIAGGADAALLTIAANGALTFASAPNFEAPADADGDNVYDVEVQVSDGNGGIDT